MASDNVSVTPGTGVTIGTRADASGVEYQRVIPQTYSTPGASGGAISDVGPGNPMPVQAVIKDGASSNLASVGVFHNTDNQSPGGFGYGLLTGGVAQLINNAGNLDRQRETGTDNIPAAGIASGTQQLASPFSTTIAANIATGVQTVTPAAMTGTNRGATWTIQAGSILTVANSNGTNSEVIVVTSVTATAFTAYFNYTKTGPGIVVSGFTYNQARDATTPDGSTGQGFAAGATFLYNGTLNNNAGGWEGERSALGEQDGATGAGTAIAAEYEYNSGGPVLSTGKPSNMGFDRGRNVQGKGLATATITAPSAGATSLTASSATAVNQLQPGTPIYLLSGGTVVEVVYASQTYTPGTTTITLQNPVVTGGETTMVFDVYAPAGPGLNGFMPTGIEIAEEALWSPTQNKFYIERSADADGMSPYNIVAESEVLWNGTGMDRARTNLAVQLLASGAQSATYTSPDQLNVNGHCLHVILNATVIGTATLTVSINAKDPGSGTYYNLLTGTAISTNSTNVYKVGPALTAAANSVANDWVPRTFQIVVTQGGGSATYSLGYNLSE